MTVSSSQEANELPSIGVKSPGSNRAMESREQPGPRPFSFSSASLSTQDFLLQTFAISRGIVMTQGVFLLCVCVMV